MTAEALARAIQTVATDKAMRRRAEELGKAIRAERGVDAAVAFIERFGASANASADRRS